MFGRLPVKPSEPDTFFSGQLVIIDSLWLIETGPFRLFILWILVDCLLRDGWIDPSLVGYQVYELGIVHKISLLFF